jgi:hypothetical protein
VVSFPDLVLQDVTVRAVLFFVVGLQQLQRAMLMQERIMCHKGMISDLLVQSSVILPHTGELVSRVWNGKPGENMISIDPL